MRFLFLFRAILFLGAAAFPSYASADDTYKVIHTYPHDPRAYTQGLVYIDGHLYESTGLNGRSSLRMDDLTTGRALQSAAVPSQYFAEGLAPWGSTLVQLTWQSHVAFVYDRFSFRLLKTLHYDCEGWGLAEDGRNLIESDGSSEIHFFDPQTFREVRHITVKDHGAQVDQLNELEYIHGQIYANVWHTDRIARISPATGQVLGWINLTGLLAPGEVSDPEAVLNGIAYDAIHDRLFVTGKLWPKLFEIKVVPAQAKMVPIHHAKDQTGTH
ncbi:MAG: glutaminyl-peptide cyclotransferase [Terracidiphilus sp.]